MYLSVITVTLNAKNVIAEQMRSVVLACQGIGYEQIIVDNGSLDGTVEFIAAKSEGNIKLVKNEKNLGFAAANNQGVKIAQGRFILFLNPDMRLIGDGSLAKAVVWMEQNPQAGIMSCKLVNEAGGKNKRQGPRRFPKVFDQLIILLKLAHIFPWLLNRYHYQDFDLEKIQIVDTVRGSFMLVRREIIDRLGGQAFDPRYFIWFEEVDLCREAEKIGYQTAYNPEISCVDLVGQTFKNLDQVWKQKQFTKSMLSYFQKWEPWWKWIWIALFKPVGIGLAFIYSVISVIGQCINSKFKEQKSKL